MKRAVLFIAVLLSMLPEAVSARVTDAQVETYESAKKAYYNKDFTAAESAILALMDEVGENGYLDYDLANIYFKQGKLGEAIRYYEKARLKLPRFGDIRINLEQALARRTEALEPSFTEYVLASFYFWNAWLNAAEFSSLFAAVSLLFWGNMAYRAWHGARLVTAVTATAILFYAYLGAGLYLKTETETPGAYAIVLGDKVEARASYLEQEQPLFMVSEGIKVRIIDEQDFAGGKSWRRILLPQGQAGWVEAEAVGEI